MVYIRNPTILTDLTDLYKLNLIYVMNSLNKIQVILHHLLAFYKKIFTKKYKSLYLLAKSGTVTIQTSSYTVYEELYRVPFRELYRWNEQRHSRNRLTAHNVDLGSGYFSSRTQHGGSYVAATFRPVSRMSG